MKLLPGLVIILMFFIVLGSETAKACGGYEDQPIIKIDSWGIK